MKSKVFQDACNIWNVYVKKEIFHFLSFLFVSRDTSQQEAQKRNSQFINKKNKYIQSPE
jgi:hypothetical protein